LLVALIHEQRATPSSAEGEFARICLGEQSASSISIPLFRFHSVQKIGKKGSRIYEDLR
jgi:hypothetical protein